jgi:glycosyltransferase involved in cell wall biosynthesis
VPKITVVLTSYNHSKYLREAIDSVLNQTFQDFELIIWDDASTDNSWNIISSYTDPRINTAQSESNSAWSAWIPLLNGKLSSDYIATHHSDDVWEPDKLSEQVSFLNSNPSCGAVFTNVTPIGENGEIFADKKHFYYSIFDQRNRTRQGWLNRFFYDGNCLCHPSVLMRREALEDAGGYRYGLPQLGDFDLWIRLCLKYDIYVLPKRLTKFRIRANEANASGNKPTARIRSRFEILKILENYRKIDDINELLAVLPKAREYHSNKGFNIDFLLAMVAVHDGPAVWFKLFGLNLLYELLNNIECATAIKSLYNFDSTNFKELTATYDIFSHERLAEMDTELVKLSQVLAERDSSLASLNHALAERDSNLASLNQALAERDSNLASLNHTLAERDSNLASLNHTLAERDSNLASLNRAFVEANLKITRLISSRSWRLTRPLRLFGRLLRGELKAGVEGPRDHGGD